MRRNSKPRKENFSPFDKSTIRLLSSLTSTRSLPNSSRNRLSPAFTSQVMSRMRVNQYHQIVRKTGILDVGVLAAPRGSNRLFQHPIHLGEVEITEQRRNDSPNA